MAAMVVVTIVDAEAEELVSDEVQVIFAQKLSKNSTVGEYCMGVHREAGGRTLVSAQPITCRPQ